MAAMAGAAAAAGGGGGGGDCVGRQLRATGDSRWIDVPRPCVVVVVVHDSSSSRAWGMSAGHQRLSIRGHARFTYENNLEALIIRLMPDLGHQVEKEARIASIAKEKEARIAGFAQEKEARLSGDQSAINSIAALVRQQAYTECPPPQNMSTQAA
ncbi:hypothetical protein DFH27DRAFT_622539 [Peziza echinospora]|nr:hypothetical protein DFH27DRAFT_622539 [Peziza echinospora]